MDADRTDHDQRLKSLLKEFFQQFLCCFFPKWAERFDFGELVWLDKELFLSPPAGERRHVDLLARLQIRAGELPPSAQCDGLLILVHVEVESADSVQQFRPRMFEYYVQLRREYNLPVLPIGLYLRVGLDGVGWDSYEERFWEHVLVRFQFAYVGLPALDAEEYVKGEQLIGAALSSLMRVPAQRRVELHLEALQRIAESSENDRRRYLLAECVEAYAKLDENDRHLLEGMLDKEKYEKVRPFMITTFERGVLEGKREGMLEGKREGMLETLLAQLEEKFGRLSPEIVQRISASNSEQLHRLTRDVLKAGSLRELRLED